MFQRLKGDFGTFKVTKVVKASAEADQRPDPQQGRNRGHLQLPLRRRGAAQDHRHWGRYRARRR